MPEVSAINTNGKKDYLFHFSPKIWLFRKQYVIIYILSASWQKGGVKVNILFSIASAIMINIISYYICKWLDGERR